MHSWHPAKPQKIGIIVMQFKKFFTQKCLQGWEQWNYLKNHCLQYIEKKKRIYHWLGSRGLVVYKELGKGKAQ